MPTHLRVTIDPDRCVGYGRCAAVAAGVFEIDEDTNKAFFEESEIEAAAPATIFGAARACPTQAISIEQFGRRVYPTVLAPLPAEVQRLLADPPDESE
jgi:ferredoxin